MDDNKIDGLVDKIMFLFDKVAIEYGEDPYEDEEERKIFKFDLKSLIKNTYDL